jgi:biopolymer transport protein ExbD
MPLVNIESDDGGAEVNMTPMIDCVFLLLIFFLCTAALKKPMRILPIELSPASHAKEQRVQQEIVVSVTREGDRYLFDGATWNNQAPVGRGEFLAYVQELAAKDAEQPVRLDIDRRAPYVHVVEIIDTLERYGMRRVHIKTSHGAAGD